MRAAFTTQPGPAAVRQRGHARNAAGTPGDDRRRARRACTPRDRSDERRGRAATGRAGGGGRRAPRWSIRWRGRWRCRSTWRPSWSGFRLRQLGDGGPARCATGRGRRCRDAAGRRAVRRAAPATASSWRAACRQHVACTVVIGAGAIDASGATLAGGVIGMFEAAAEAGRDAAGDRRSVDRRGGPVPDRPLRDRRARDRDDRAAGGRRRGDSPGGVGQTQLRRRACR